MSQKDDLISRQDAIDVFIKWFFDVFGIGRSDRMTTLLERLKEIPPAQPDTYEALRILDAINSSGRLDYGDYCDLHDAISEIGGA